MLPSELAHLRLQVDDLERHAEEAVGDAIEMRRIAHEAVALERALAALEEELAQQTAQITVARNRLKRIRARR